MTAPVFPFGEGPTDRVVFEFLRSRLFPDQAFREFVSVGGKENFRSKIPDTVQNEILPGRYMCILVFRDLDAGEKPSNVAQSFRDLIWDLLSAWNLQPSIHPLPQHPNIYVCRTDPTSTAPGLRLVLHLADNAALDLPMALPNHTTDGYVLAAGLTDAVLGRFAGSPKVKSDAQTLYDLVTNSLPVAVKQAGITFGEDKDYLAAYLCATRFWVVRRNEEQALLVRVILDRAWKYDPDTVHRVFSTWLTAIEEAIR